MAFELLIHGVDYTNEFLKETLVIRESLQARGSTMSCAVQADVGSVVVPPKAGQQVVFKRDGIIEFAGRVSNVLETQPLGAKNLIYKMNCTDYTIDLDAHLIIRDYPSQAASDIVRSIVGDVGLGFTTNNIAGGTIIVGELEADYDRPSDMISRVAESIEHQWYVDYLRDMHFFYVLDEPAPLEVINIDTDTDTYFDLEREEMWDQVKNRIWLKGAKVKSDNLDNIVFTADGDQKFVALNYEPWSTEALEVTVNGVPYNVLLDTVDGQAGDGTGGPGEVFLCIDNWGVRFPEGHQPSEGIPVEIDYNYANEVVVMVEDPESIAIMAEREHIEGAPSDGVHELKFEIPSLRVESSQTIWEYGQLLLARYAKLVWAYRFSSHYQGWRAGQNTRIVSAARGVDHRLYVTGVTKTIRTQVEQSLFEYQIEAQTSPFPG
ncbi:MAG: hypothetical protein M0Q49_03265 [Porticoccaceae bacterium]|nr:hypothetical protein [Porticoccaceae bacterium]